MKPAYRLAVIVASAVIGLAGIVGAWLLVGGGSEPPPAATGQNAEITRATLAQNDGVNGNKCYVAVDGVVYEIQGSPLWVNGRHEPSGGRAQCGRDLTDVIGQSPHGRSKLNLLTVVGRLTE